jgi:hypothetical protein
MSQTPEELTRNVLDVSVTERGQFRSCRRKWKLATLDNLEPKTPNPALPIGTGVHKALEVFRRSRSIQKALEAFAEWYDGEAKKWAEDEVPFEVMEDLVDQYSLCVQVLTNYAEYDKVAKVQIGDVLAIEGVLTAKGKEQLGKPKPPKGYPPVQIHEESGRLLVPIVDPVTKEPLSGEPCLSSRIDLLAGRKTPKKGIWVWDYKTASSASGEEGIDFDDQITGYCYIVWRWLGIIPRGVVLDTLIKKEIKPPRWGKNGKLSYAKDQLTTPTLYREALKEAGLIGPGGTILSENHEGCLEALLARGWDPWFRRYEGVRNDFEILDYERFLHQTYLEMAGGAGLPADHPFFYPNPVTNPFSVCQTCTVRRICRAMSDGSDWEGLIEDEFRVGEDRKAA